MLDLRGKRVLITGAGGGIGRGAALAFAREDSELLLADIDPGKLAELDAELKRAGTRSRCYVVDVAGERKVREPAASVEADVGGLVSFGMITSYCANRFALVGFSEGLSREAWHRGVRVTAFAPGLPGHRTSEA